MTPMKKTVAIALVALLVLGAMATALTALTVLDGDDDRQGSPAQSPSQEQTSRSESPSESSSGSPDDGESPPSQSPEGEREGKLAPFANQQVKWTACGDELECARMQVPLDYAKPDGKRISLRLARHLADPGKRIGSLVINPGGPGEPGSETATYADELLDAKVVAAYDVVGFDPRGTGRSAPVDCLSDKELTEYLAADPTPDDAAEVKELEAASKAFAEGCRKRSGELVDHVSTVEAARDMDLLRAVLDEEKLTYMGFSYGTKLGAVYAELFPKRVGRFVLDAALDPTVGQLESSLVQAEGFETALRSYVADCQRKKGCPVAAEDGAQGKKAVDQGMRKIADLLERIGEKPLPADGRKLQGGDAFYGVVTPLYSEEYWPLLSSALREAFRGDGTELLELSDEYNEREDDTYENNSSEAISVIDCLDDPGSITVEQVPEYIEKFEKVAPTFGEVFAWGLPACSGFGFDKGRDIPVKAKGAAPILVVGTTRDPATPMVWAEALADQLDSGVLIRRDGDGHGGYNVGNACVDRAVDNYLLRGKVPRNGLSC